jgi:P27 family predicted phage terminase small subunit
MPGNGSSGRRPLPAAIASLGPRRHRKRSNLGSAELGADEPPMPEHLSAAAREEWERIVPELLTLGVLAKIDRGALSAYCTCHAMSLVAEAVITEKGLVVEEPVYNRQGDVIGHKQKRNPAIQAMTQFLQLKRSYLIEFGLTPASRSRLKVEKPAEPDAMDDYLAGRGIYAPTVEN